MSSCSRGQWTCPPRGRRNSTSSKPPIEVGRQTFPPRGRSTSLVLTTTTTRTACCLVRFEHVESSKECLHANASDVIRSATWLGIVPKQAMEPMIVEVTEEAEASEEEEDTVEDGQDSVVAEVASIAARTDTWRGTVLPPRQDAPATAANNPVTLPVTVIRSCKIRLRSSLTFSHCNIHDTTATTSVSSSFDDDDDVNDGRFDEDS